jgi:hypothetical protein
MLPAASKAVLKGVVPAPVMVTAAGAAGSVVSSVSSYPLIVFATGSQSRPGCSVYVTVLPTVPSATMVTLAWFAVPVNALSTMVPSWPMLLTTRV